MAFNQAEVLSSRNFRLYTVPWHATTTLPEDSVDYGTAWGTPSGQTGAYSDPGYTDGGINFNVAIERGAISVDQELDPVLRPATSRDTRLSTNLAQVTPANILSATGQGAVSTSAATTAARGHTDWDQDSDIAVNYLTVGVDVEHNGDSLPFRLALWKCQVLGGMQITLNPTDKAVVTFEVAALPDTSTSPARIAKARDILAQL